MKTPFLSLFGAVFLLSSLQVVGQGVVTDTTKSPALALMPLSPAPGSSQEKLASVSAQEPVTPTSATNQTPFTNQEPTIIQSATPQPLATSIKKNDNIQRNLFKINLPGIALRNYSFQYERVLTKRFSVAFSYRKMPSGELPLKDVLADQIPSGLSDLKLKGTAFTPEIRLYVGKKGYGRGFYLAPFYRQATFATEDLIYTYENEDGIEESVTLAGKLTGKTAGLLMGAQFSLGKYVCLDWWIVGAHGGSANGNLNAVSDKILTPDEQEDLREELENLDIPFVTKTVTVNANNASVILKGPWAGIRSGLSLGFKF
ncbi:hypothetical protein [Adhaeribacter aquaticus]|uniref:hypothetical protein n=1 Tax=Adhaeribacter aquaticus TaxID=299567 RepID=UPI0004118BB1|nr:hypothetical protein [Adhaeribacter aquaticus]